MLTADGRVVMVSGASRGIGRAVVDKLLASGFTVSGGILSGSGTVGALTIGNGGVPMG